jgi:cell division protein FtsQ
MWDNPVALNRVSDLLSAAAALAVLYAALRWAVHLPIFAVQEVRVGGVTKHMTLDQVEAIAKRDMHGTFFTLDLPAIRASFEKLPWVRQVTLRRQWPDRLDVTVEEHVPFARWGSLGLVNIQGEVFEAAYDGKLPVFEGPQGAAKEIKARYGEFRQDLLAIGLTPVRVQLSERRAWRLLLDSGTTFELGRDQVRTRLQRYVAHHAGTVEKLARQIDYIDLRYVNGFAVRIPELAREGMDGPVRKDAPRKHVPLPKA